MSSSKAMAPDVHEDASRRTFVLLGAVSLAFTACRALFVWQSPNIVAARPNPGPELVTPWVRWAIVEHDGLETVVALGGMLSFVALAVAVALRFRTLRPNLVGMLLAASGLGCALYWTLQTRSSEFLTPSHGAAFGWLLGVGAFTAALAFALTQATRGVQLAVIALAFSGFVGLVVLSLPPAALEDYCYYLGPALKLLQGERIGTFYMQYELLGTLLFVVMAAGGLLLHQMQLVLALVFCLWFLLYAQLIRRLFSHRAIALQLALALVAMRFLAIRDHPAGLPQILPTRLDMWVPLALAVERFGLRSRKTAAAFALAYAFDATFGFLSAFAYAIALGVSWLASTPRGEFRKRALELVPHAGLLVAVALLQKLIFGSFVSPSASHYVSLQLGFLPISEHSLFWPIGLALGCAALLFTLQRDRRESRIGLFLCLVAVVHLTYFFGRSHDHNLLNVSSAWLFPVFLALDQAVELRRVRFELGAALVCGLLLLCAAQAETKWARASERLAHGPWLPPHPVEAQLDAYRGALKPGVALLEIADAYPNYRLGLAQLGFFAPFGSNVILADTARSLRVRFESGLSLLTLDPRIPVWLTELERTGELVSPGTRLQVARQQRLTVISQQRAP